MIEEWKIIPFEDRYEVSNLGNIRNIKTKHIKSCRTNKGGYLRVTLYPSGLTYTVHQLVARVWLSTTYVVGLEVDHLDSNKLNNTVNNLEWVTQQENIRRISERGRKANINGSNNPAATINEDIAYSIKYSFNLTNTEAAKQFNTSLSVVEKIRARDRWTSVVDEELEALFLGRKVGYAKAKTANLLAETSKKLNEDILSGKYTVSELTSKYGVSKSTIYRRKAKLTN